MTTKKPTGFSSDASATQHSHRIALGAILRALRETRDLSQAALAEWLGVSTQTVLRYELGRTEIPRDRLRQLATLFERTEASLLDAAEREVQARQTRAAGPSDAPRPTGPIPVPRLRKGMAKRRAERDSAGVLTRMDMGSVTPQSPRTGPSRLDSAHGSAVAAIHSPPAVAWLYTELVSRLITAGVDEHDARLTAAWLRRPELLPALRRGLEGEVPTADKAIALWEALFAVLEPWLMGRGSRR